MVRTVCHCIKINIKVTGSYTIKYSQAIIKEITHMRYKVTDLTQKTIKKQKKLKKNMETNKTNQTDVKNTLIY